MRSHIREVQREVQSLKDSREIDDFEIAHNGKHPTVTFLVKGVWYSTPFPSTPRTPYANNFVRQQIRRRIRALNIS